MHGTFLQTLRLAVRSLLLQKLRASLAALGIFIGTSTVIWLVAMGEGVSYQAQEQIKDLGATNIIVRSVKPPHDSSNNTGPMARYGLLRADYERILSNVPTITHAAPMREIQREIQVQDRTADAKLVGCTAPYGQLNGLGIARGRWMNGRDEGDNVIVLADETARQLFPYENPIGQSVRMGREIYVVIGQTKPRLAAAAIGGSLDARDFNRDAYIPLDTFKKRIGDMVFIRRSGTFGGETVELNQITLTVDDIGNVDATAAVVERLLDRFHDVADVAVVVPKELLDQAEKTRAMFNVLLVVIAGISLAVGGIGIMNIMLATVTERTREIGIRRALGAKRKDIIGQFLSETLVLTAGGGVLGVLFGLMCGPIFRGLRTLVTAVSPDSLPAVVQSIEPRVAPWSVVLALCISIGVGIVFGVYPARQAAYMDPIEALRHE